MKKLILSSLLMTSIITIPISTFAKEPENLVKTENKLINYYNSGQYQRDIDKVTNKAIHYAKKRIDSNNQLNNPKRLAAVFDIDETVLSNYPDLVRMNFGGTDKAVAAAEDAAKDKPIKSVFKLYQLLRDNKVAIFFITGRYRYQKPATIENLKSAGFKHWQGLFFRPFHYNEKSAVPYKSHVREQLEKRGYDVIITVGDQWSDIKGGFADKGFKLPDPFYYIP